MKHPFLPFVETLANALDTAASIPAPGTVSAKSPGVAANSPAALIFSPHPDDECIIGALPLRLRRQADFNVINVAVTLGSNLQRRPGRTAELADACQCLDFILENPVPEGLEDINPKGREENPEDWRTAVGIMRDQINNYQPKVIFFPHAKDWNSTHIGTHLLVMDALGQADLKAAVYLIETEFWGAMEDPNLMVESSAEDVADLVAATSLHVGEVERNPYHLSLPFWMVDNVRRGGEVVGGQGGDAPDFTFATLYRISQWDPEKKTKLSCPGGFLPQDKSPSVLGF